HVEFPVVLPAQPLQGHGDVLADEQRLEGDHGVGPPVAHRLFEVTEPPDRRAIARHHATAVPGNARSSRRASFPSRGPSDERGNEKRMQVPTPGRLCTSTWPWNSWTRA